MNKKELLANLLFRTGIINLIKFYSDLFNKKLIILAYHRIYNISTNEDEFISDIDLISATSKDFEWQVCFLKENFQVTTFREYFNFIKVHKSAVIITFDDGFKDNYDIAYPILKKHGIPAVFYVSVDYIGTKNHFWFELLVSIIRQIPNLHLSHICGLLGISISDDRALLQNLALQNMKKIPNTKRLEIIDSIKDFCEKNNILFLDNDAIPMSWDNVKEMSKNGMEIGSHTLSHPILTKLTLKQRDDEISKSKAQLEQKLDSECVSISYPNGSAGDYDEELMNVVKTTGYVFGCSYISGVNDIDNLKIFELRRLHVERYITNNYFACMLVLPRLFH
jgi:peptidoglycan/xylan/chitin deacetylase (PgdA/CDA1 family)